MTELDKLKISILKNDRNDNIKLVKDCVKRIVATNRKEDGTVENIARENAREEMILRAFKVMVDSISYLTLHIEDLKKKGCELNNKEMSDCKIKKDMYFFDLLSLEKEISIDKIDECKKCLKSFDSKDCKEYYNLLTKHMYTLEDKTQEECKSRVSNPELCKRLKKQREDKAETLKYKIFAYSGKNPMSKAEAVEIYKLVGRTASRDKYRDYRRNSLQANKDVVLLPIV